MDPRKLRAFFHFGGDELLLVSFWGGLAPNRTEPSNEQDTIRCLEIADGQQLVPTKSQGSILIGLTPTV